jgi:PTH1 family peptidyl-tRNA hydrolase
MLLIAGLGNPGPKYEANRHNIGFMAVERIGSHWRVGPWRSRFQGLASEGSITLASGAEQRVLLLKPTTFMNLSGQSVAEAARFHKIAPSAVIVFHDELDLAPGRFRMKLGGGHAGHNGLRSIMASAVGAEFRRARLGIGHPGHKDLVHGYVLSDFSKTDITWVDALLDACARSADLLAAGQDEAYQGKVMQMAPAEKLNPRQTSRTTDFPDA